MFSIVPVLVVALWALKLFHLIPYLKPADGDGAVTADAGADARADANVLLREAVRGDPGRGRSGRNGCRRGSSGWRRCSTA